MRILIALFFLSFVSCQSQECNCYAYIYNGYGKTTSIFAEANGITKIAEVQNTLEEYEFLQLKIIKSKGDYFKVLIIRELDKDLMIGWIKKIKEIAIDDRIYSNSANLPLYSEPSTKSPIATIVPAGNVNYYTVKECNGQWIYATGEKDGILYQGWLEPEMQCANPLTNCN